MSLLMCDVTDIDLYFLASALIPLSWTWHIIPFFSLIGSLPFARKLWKRNCSDFLFGTSMREPSFWKRDPILQRVLAVSLA